MYPIKYCMFLGANCVHIECASSGWIYCVASAPKALNKSVWLARLDKLLKEPKN